MEELNNISLILESGTSDEKIKTLEELVNSKNSQIIDKIISCLDDEDIKVRGEAFSSLVLNENEISNVLIKRLQDPKKNIRAFLTLVLGNRQEVDSIKSIINLTQDERSMVRSCALGALGHLKASEARKEITQCLLDENIEVRKSALKAAIEIQEPISGEIIKTILKEKDKEIEGLLVKVKRESGPGGI